MERANAYWLLVGVSVALAFCAVAYAATYDSILRSVYDSSNTSLRIIQVSP